MQLDLPFLRAPDFDAIPEAGLAESRFLYQPRDEVVFVRVRRARRYILRIRPDGTLRVMVPRGGSQREAQAFVERNRRWIARERLRVREHQAPVEWQHGSELMLGGTYVTVEVQSCPGSDVVRYGDRVVPLREGEAVRSAIERDLRLLATLTLVPRLRELAAEHELSVRSISIRNQRSRWGSCAPNGNVALNFRLVQMPPAIRDYVLLHELMHVRQQNHSRRFWRLVEAAYPSFREAERWLRTTGRSLF